MATDLSSRGDRALDRAAQLARQWGAQLLVVHAIDQKTVVLLDAGFIPSWRQSTDPSIAIRDRIRRDLREETKQLEFEIKEGEPKQMILDTVAREGCDLIISGASGSSDLFGGMIPGSTVELVVRKPPLSIGGELPRNSPPARGSSINKRYQTDLFKAFVLAAIEAKLLYENL